MSRPRFFVPKDNIKNDLITITDDENIHLNSVLRLKVGEEIDVCCNDGIVHTAVLTEVNKKYSIAKIQNSIVTAQNMPQITLFMALIKSERMDWAVQKVTELGVDNIIPFDSQYCMIKDKGNKVDRLNRIAISASKQSGRAVLPTISNTLKFDEMLNELRKYKQIVLAYENNGTNAIDVLSKLNNKDDIAIIIGSEGGFTEGEVRQIIDCGAKVISLGKTILRAETASVALLSAIKYQLGLWGKE